MSPHTVRRWIARHPLAWVLGLALAVCGAQSAAIVHELGHVASATAAQERGDDGAAASASHDCPLCLLAAALGGGAPAPESLAVAVPTATIAVAPSAGVAFVPRFALAYGSRAPPRAPATSA